MNDNPLSLEFFKGRNERLAQENARLRRDLESGKLLNSEGDGTTPGDRKLLNYRMDQYEKHADAADARMARVEEKLTNIQLTLAGLATKDSIRNWGIAVIAIVLATGFAVGAIMLQSAGNQLSAFQAGLSAIQTAVSIAPSHPAIAPSPTVQSKPGG